MRIHPSRILVIVITLAVIALGTGQLMAAKKPPGGGGGCPVPGPACLCPAIYDPVVCDGGCQYSNPCEGACAGATNCVRTGPGTIGPLELCCGCDLSGSTSNAHHQ